MEQKRQESIVVVSEQREKVASSCQAYSSYNSPSKKVNPDYSLLKIVSRLDCLPGNCSFASNSKILLESSNSHHLHIMCQVGKKNGIASQ